MNKMKFVIVAPRQDNGGSIVLHALCHYLDELDYNAKIFYIGPYVYKRNKVNRLLFWLRWLVFIGKDTTKSILAKLFKQRLLKYENKFTGYIECPIKGCKRKYMPFVDDNTIVVYPEIVFGNFLNAKNVVRWFLYYNRYPDQRHQAYGEKDLFICFREIFNDIELNPKIYTVTTPYFDLSKYKQFNFGNRKGTCYIVRKGKNRLDLPKTFDGVIIDRLSEKEKINTFNRCEFCVSYDTQTAYSKIAALCGCISVIIPEEGKSKENYRGAQEESIGIAWGMSEDEIEYARQTKEKVADRLVAYNENGKRATIEFIKLCAMYFKI